MLSKTELLAREAKARKKHIAEKANKEVVSLVESFVALGLSREKAIVAAGAEKIIADMKAAGVDPKLGSTLVKEVIANEKPSSDTWANLIGCMGGN